MIRVCDVLSLVIALSLITAYNAAGQPWFVGDMLSILIVGTALKLFKITSFRDGSILLTLCMIYDFFFALGASFIIG